MPTVVSVQDLRKRYRSRDPWAVDGVSFQLEAGEAFGLLGPNGAGKTSIVKMISGLLRPDAGKISLFGSDPGNPAARVDLGATGISDVDDRMRRLLGRADTKRHSVARRSGAARAEYIRLPLGS